MTDTAPTTPTGVSLAAARHYPSESALDGLDRIRDLAVDDANATHSVRAGLVTLSFGSEAVDPNTYEFDLEPPAARRLARQLLDTADLAGATEE